MSATTSEFPSADQANATLDQLYIERFFAKMAEQGFVPSTNEEAMAVLETAAQLDSLPEKSAEAEQTNWFGQANEKLANHLAAQGYGVDFRQQAAEQEKQALVYALASNPEIYKAALAVELAQDESN